MSTTRIALRLDDRIHYWREVALGIADWIQSRRPDWVLDELPAWEGPLERRIAAWPGQGAILGLGPEGREEYELWHRRGLPTVDVGNHGLEPASLRVEADDAAIGRLAADHLRALGCRGFLYVGMPVAESWDFSRRRGAGFAAGLAAAPATCDGFDQSALDAALRDAARPLGVFACSDLVALRVVERCHALELDVPGAVAVLGVDDDPTRCRRCQPALASIDPAARRIGREAAAWLARLIAGEAAPHAPVRVPPLRVVARGTAPAVAVDPVVAAARAVIVRRHREALTVDELAAELGLHPRSLQRRFRRALGRGIVDCIHDARLDAVETLLRASDLPLTAVATRAGFASYRSMAALFRRRHGTSAGAWRRSTRG